MEYTLITFDYTQSTNQEWKTLIREYLHSAKSFEIHCWTEEPEWIELALRYGELKETDWAYGKVVSGEVTPDFVELILNQPKPADTEIYNKMGLLTKSVFCKLLTHEVVKNEHCPVMTS